MAHPLTRRRALQGLGIIGAAAALPAAVAIPAAARSNRPRRPSELSVSSHTFSVGRIRVTAIRDGALQLPVGAIGTNAPADAVEQLLANYGLPTGGVPTHVTTLMLERDGVRTLVDTGAGDWAFPAVAESGQLVPTLASLGVEPGAVDHIVLSHFHPDHVGGASTEGRPTFPSATYHLSADERRFLDGYRGDDDVVQTALRMLAPVLPSSQTFGDGDEVVPGLTVIAAPGHTPGHCAFLVESDGERLLIASDAVTHPVAFFEHPEWLFGFDMLPEPTVATRRRLLALAADERIPIWASHIPFPGIGQVSRTESAFRFTPVAVL